MMAVVEVDAGQAAERGKATDEEGQRTPPPPPQPVAAVRPHHQPTPDHPPYCWMIGEAIDALAEDSGSSEDSISAFICARHPGAPPEHDRFLRHYLGKHVAEGFFVRTAAGRYERCPEVNADAVEQAGAGSCKPASVEAKRGRGRPRRNGSSSAPPAAAKDSVPMSLVAVADKDGSQAPSLKPKRRRRVHRLGMIMTRDSSGEALVVGKKHGSEVPYTLDKEHEPPRELGLVIFGDSSVTSTMDKACTEVPPTTPPVGGDQPLDLALVTTTEVSVPEPVPTPPMDKDGGQPLNLALVTTTEVPVPEPAPNSTPAMDKDGDQPLNLALVTTTEVPVPVPVPEPVPTPMDKDGGQPLNLALVTTTEVSVPELAPNSTPAMDKDGDHPLDLALVTTTEMPVSEPAPTPMPAMDMDGGDASSIMDKNESICTTPTVPEPGSHACKLALMAAAAAGFVPMLVAGKKGGLKESPSAAYKDVLKPRKAASAPTAGKKAGGKALSATPGSRRQRKSASFATGDRSALTPGKKLGCKVLFASPKSTPVIAGGSTPASVADQGDMEASAAMKQHGQPHKLVLKKKPRKLYPATADEISDDPGLVLLALPSQTLAASNS